MKFLDERLPLFEGIFRGIDRLEEFDEDIAGFDFEFALFHDVVSTRTGDRHKWDARLNRHNRSSLLEFLQTAVGTACALGIDEERLAVAQRDGGFLEAVDGRFAIEAVDGNEVGKMKSLADDRPFEK